jgi:hypothetical protein
MSDELTKIEELETRLKKIEILLANLESDMQKVKDILS